MCAEKVRRFQLHALRHRPIAAADPDLLGCDWQSSDRFRLYASLFNLQERGRLFIGHGVEVYEGMIIGIHSRDNDLLLMH